MKFKEYVNKMGAIKIEDIYFIPNENSDIERYNVITELFRLECKTNEELKDCTDFEPESNEEVVEIVKGFNIPKHERLTIQCYTIGMGKNNVDSLVKFNVFNDKGEFVLDEQFDAYVFSDDGREYFINGIIRAMKELGHKDVDATFFLTRDEEGMLEDYKRFNHLYK